MHLFLSLLSLYPISQSKHVSGWSFMAQFSMFMQYRLHLLTLPLHSPHFGSLHFPHFVSFCKRPYPMSHVVRHTPLQSQQQNSTEPSPPSQQSVAKANCICAMKIEIRIEWMNRTEYIQILAVYTGGAVSLILERSPLRLDVQGLYRILLSNDGRKNLLFDWRCLGTRVARIRKAPHPSADAAA